MNSKPAADARLSFAERLSTALLRAREPTSPSGLARAFNLRSNGKNVTPHGVRKWLVGESMPTKDKTQILARWLNVSPEWLYFGDDANGDVEMQSVFDGLPGEQSRLINDIQKLDEPGTMLVRHLVDALINLTAKPSPALAKPSRSRSRRGPSSESEGGAEQAATRLADHLNKGFYANNGRRKDAVRAAIVQASFVLRGQLGDQRVEQILKREGIPDEVVARVMSGDSEKLRARPKQDPATT